MLTLFLAVPINTLNSRLRGLFGNPLQTVALKISRFFPTEHRTGAELQNQHLIGSTLWG